LCLARCGLKNALINYYSMRIDILSSKLELTSALSDYIEKKLQKLEKFLKRFPQESVTIKAELGKTTDHHEKGSIFRAEGRVTVPHTTFYADAVQEDLYAAIDKVADELKRQILADKEKYISARRG